MQSKPNITLLTLLIFFGALFCSLSASATEPVGFGLLMKYAQKAFIPQLFVIRPDGTLLARLNPDAYESKKSKGNDPIKLARILASYLPASRRSSGGSHER